MTTVKQGCLKAIFGWMKGPEQESPQSLPYRLRDNFLSPAEASFYRVLKSTIEKRFLVCPKVSLRDIFYVARPNENSRYYNKISQKHVDFLLCDLAILRPLIGVELDDSSHQRSGRVERDLFVDQVFATAKLPLLHIAAQRDYDTRQVESLLNQSIQISKPTVNTP